MQHHSGMSFKSGPQPPEAGGPQGGPQPLPGALLKRYLSDLSLSGELAHFCVLCFWVLSRGHICGIQEIVKIFPFTSQWYSQSAENRFLLLRCQLVCQTFFETNGYPFFTVYQDSIQTQVFASAIACCLNCWYLSAPSGIPQASQIW